jgi:hypothetical protein
VISTEAGFVGLWRVVEDAAATDSCTGNAAVTNNFSYL